MLNGLNGQTLRKQYKEVISGYRSWEQLEHAQEYLLFPDNLGPDLSLDETCLSNGDVYTILTNKAGHGRNGTLVAIVRGVSSDNVIDMLAKLPYNKRIRVRTITTDLSSAMMLIAMTSFPHAKLINDRFHVQQLISEAVDQMRIRLRWEVLDEENRQIKEHKLKLEKAKTREERGKIGKWRPTFMSNGETMPQIMARSKHIVMKHNTKWNVQQQERAKILFDKFPRLQSAYELSMNLTEIMNKKIKSSEGRLELAKWYKDVESFAEDSFNKVLNTFQNHYNTIINYFDERLTNASAESFNAKIKALRSQFRGVRDIKFFMFRLSKLYA